MGPIVVALMPCAVLALVQIALPDIDFETPNLVYGMVLIATFIAYMVVAVRQYGRWLRMHYTDLEHKEMRLSHTLVIGFMLMLMVYNVTYNWQMSLIIHLIALPLMVFLLWRVETLPKLEEAEEHGEDEDNIVLKSEKLPEPDFPPELAQGAVEEQQQKTGCEVSSPKKAGAVALTYIGQLLAKHCEYTQLYLRSDLTLTELSVAVGVNRYYLGQYFANQGSSYYAYIHDLRIRHFISRYRETHSTSHSADAQPLTAQQLAQESGYHSYSTFSTAFKQRTGQSVTAWMRQEEREANK